MLSFFRKHQKGFFLFTTVIIILSFTFFGAFSTFQNSPDTPSDRELGKAIDGSPIMEQELSAMVRFLSTGFEDRGLSQKRIPNLLNDSLIVKDFFSTGMGVMLAGRYFDQIKDDVETRLKKAKHYRHYAHPQAPLLSAEAVWEQFNPSLTQRLTLLKGMDEPSLDAFAQLCGLYVEQGRLHPEMVKRFVTAQQKQYSWLQPDPMLAHQNFGMFGYECLEDWTGHRFLELAAQFIINAAALAEQKGYKVSLQEARSDLYQNAFSKLREVSGGQELTASQGMEYIRTELASLGLDENKAIKLWRKALLFRRLFQDTGNAVLFDHLAHQEFDAFAKETVSIDLYELPTSLKFRSFRDMLKFQVYLDAVSPAGKRKLTIPKNYFSPAECEKRCPSLAVRNYRLEIAETSKDMAALNISLKQTWDWELQEANWESLKKEFPILDLIKDVSKEARYAALEKCDAPTRAKIDQFARRQILEAHPEWIQAALDKAPLQTLTVGFRSKGGKLPFEGLENSERLLELLDQAPLMGELDGSSQAQMAAHELAHFCTDGNQIYKIAVVQRSQQKEMVAFDEANRDGTLDDLLDKQLQDAYVEVRKKDPSAFQQEDGSWKPFGNVKDAVAAKVYADLLKSIENEARAAGKEVDGKPSYAFYAHHRLLPYLSEARNHLAIEQDDQIFVNTLTEVSPLVDEDSLGAQWKLTKIHRDVNRGEASHELKQALFTDQLNGWSAVGAESDGHLMFFKVLERKQRTEPDANQISWGHQALSIDAQRALTQQLLDQIQTKKAIF